MSRVNSPDEELIFARREVECGGEKSSVRESESRREDGSEKKMAVRNCSEKREREMEARKNRRG